MKQFYHFEFFLSIKNSKIVLIQEEKYMVFDELREIIAGQLGVDEDEITMATDLIDDLNTDSLDLVEIMMAIEEHFGMEEVPEDELENLRTIGDIVEYIEAHA